MSNCALPARRDVKVPVCDADIMIVGAGISGTIAATLLGRAGYNVLLIDRYATFPRDFRAEHLDGVQIEQLSRLGLLDGLTAGVTRGETVAVGRRGRLVEIGKTVNFGMPYDLMVNTARRLLPPGVTSVCSRVVDVAANDTRQQVWLADGRVLTARLLVVASGLGYALCQKLGIQRRVVRAAHSLTFGFNIVPVAAPAFEHSFVVYQGEHLADRIDYLAIFTMGSLTRANLFTYRDYRDGWTAAFRADPDACLHAALPGLARVIGGYRTVGKIDVRPMELYVSEGFRRDGVVLIGDAYQTSCPAAGTGITRILTEVERLCLVHIPDWFRTEGMDRAKITAFYDDPCKCACDAQAAHDAEYRRSVSTETGLRWSFHRQQVYVRRRLRAWAMQQVIMVRKPLGGFGIDQPVLHSHAGLGVIEAGKPDHAR